jgi:hypothetical protein
MRLHRAARGNLRILSCSVSDRGARDLSCTLAFARSELRLALEADEESVEDDTVEVVPLRAANRPLQFIAGDIF